MNSYEKVEKKKNSIKDLLLLLLMFFIFIIIVIASLKFGKIDVSLPTGNMDIFDINISYDNNNDEKTLVNNEKYYNSDTYNIKNNKENINGDNNINNNYDIENGENSDNNISGTFGISDKDIEWQNNAKLRIFENYAYQMKNIIAPGSTNTYNFVIRNNNSFPINYTFSTIEENEYKINVKYRLKQNGKYVIGDSKSWFSYDELAVENAVLLSKSKCLYSLEWKWIDTDYDNIPGTSADAIYKLMMRVNSSQYIE